MVWFLLGVAVLACLLFLINWGSTANPAKVVQAIKYVAIGVGVGVIALVALTRNFQLIWGLGVVALPWILRFNGLRRAWKAMKGPTQGQRSGISCRFFDMSLDHDSGDMDGRIKEGRFAGALLSELSMEEGATLFQDVDHSGDTRSRQLLEAYLDRRFGGDWRPESGPDERQSEEPRPRSGAMSRQEALDLLGLQGGADEDAIKAAHRRLMKQVHPDAGGSAHLAALINQAKDVLLGR